MVTCDAEPVRAVLARAGVAQVRVAFEPRAAQEAGAAGAALVVADQLEAALELREPTEDAEHLAHAGAARATGEVQQRRAGGLARARRDAG